MTDTNLELAKSHFLKGLEFFNQKMYLEAEHSFRSSLSIVPDRESTLINLSATLLKLGKYLESEEISKYALNINNSKYESWLNLGAALRELCQYDEALAAYDKAIGLKPDCAEAWSNRGNALEELKRYDQALAAYDKAIGLKPDYAEAWYNRGNALEELKQYEQALTSFNRAIGLKPDFAKAWSNRGNVLKDIGRFSDAEASYREAIRLDPEFLSAQSNLLFALNYVEKLGFQGALAEAKSFGLKVSEKALPKFTNWEVPTDTKKLRIGFVSGDLREHPVGYFLEGLLEHLDVSQFELFAFPTTLTSDDLTHRIKPFFNDWTPLYGMSDHAAARLVHQKRIHILIDLSGHTAHNRLAVFSYKPAPVQVSWLGYFATTGLPEMDYFLGDPQMSPANEAYLFTEAIWNLAETWLCLKPPVHTVAVSTLPASKNGFFTFGSCGNLAKMNNKVVETWSSILHRVPSSRLLLKSKQLGDLSQVEEVKSRFLKFDILFERLLLEGPASRETYFKTYQRIDVVLDTFPYPGGTTSIDSLWMGVPVLTLKGDRFLSHLGESIAANAGNSDWIGANINDYIDKAVQFASNLDQLAQLRSKLRGRVLTSPLFDAPRFAENFGKALWGMWISAHKSKST